VVAPSSIAGSFAGRLFLTIKEKIMANQKSTRGGTSEQHAKAGSQSHKNTNASASGKGSSTRGGTSEQHAKAGSQSHKNSKASASTSGKSGSTRGGSSAQHAKAGSQSRKNS
jgi:hypothetical protein